MRTNSGEAWVTATLEAINYNHYNDFNAAIDRIKNLEEKMKKMKKRAWKKHF